MPCWVRGLRQRYYLQFVRKRVLLQGRSLHCVHSRTMQDLHKRPHLCLMPPRKLCKHHFKHLQQLYFELHYLLELY